MSKMDSIQITPKLILIFLISIATPTASGIWWLSQMSSDLNHLQEVVNDLPISDNTGLVERITAIEINSQNNLESIQKLNADVDKLVDHIDKSFKKITENLNTNPLSLN